MAVNFQPQVWGDKVFSPITNAVQQERQRQHQKSLADARNALDQQRIDETARANKSREDLAKNLFNMVQLPQAERASADYKQKGVDRKALNLHQARKQVHEESMKDWKKAQADVTGNWMIPNSHWNPFAWIPGVRTEKELRGAISTPSYVPDVNMNVSPNVNQAIRNSVRIDQSADNEDLMSQGGIQ